MSDNNFVKELARKSGVSEAECRRLLASRFFFKPNVTPPDTWVKMPSSNHIEGWCYEMTKLTVTAGVEKFKDELWLRLACCAFPNIATGDQVKLVINDFLGKQWLEPNLRTFIIKPKDFVLVKTKAPMTHILFCLNKIPEKNFITMQTK
jgi:hypothetical protein